MQFFGLAIKRANKCVDWAPIYAQLCSQMKASGEPTGRHIAVESAVRGRATAEYCRLSLHTVRMTPQGTMKSTEQASPASLSLWASAYKATRTCYVSMPRYM